MPVTTSFTLENGQARLAYWQCGNRECHFREFLPDRLTKPQVALEAISAEEGFKVGLPFLCCTSLNLKP